ncbi:MAG: phospho-sugar mutase [Oscillospiraceae bacterium]|jgi:phosphoglucomutase|nr:phospho-sugar mutase [Oscillospiraceae bacterium]
MGLFGFFKKKAVLPWPLKENGEPETAVLLCHTEPRGLETEITVSMLRSYGIPAVTGLTGEGLIGELYTGAPSFGTDVFVPESMLEDATALLGDNGSDEDGFSDGAADGDTGSADNAAAVIESADVREYKKWLRSPYLSDEERRELAGISGNLFEIEERFFEPLMFGTAGLRGIMALGTNRMNVHTVRHATQAFAEIILEDAQWDTDKKMEVAVCRDCRTGGRLFAEETAAVLAGNGIYVRVFDDMRPTPELSFAIRHYGCAAGINITASHNTREYNGYKVYWSDGAQLPPREAERIAERMKRLDVFTSVKRIEYAEAAARGMITVMGSETDDAFLERVIQEARLGAADAAGDNSRGLKIVYTPFHGAGRVLVPEALSRLGFTDVTTVAEQMTPDGSFPTVLSPNPENPGSFKLAISIAREQNAELIIGTDPDCDRIAALTQRAGGYEHISGHKTGVLLLDYIAAGLRSSGFMPKNPVALKSIVTTDMARRVAESHGVRCIDTFTGFKFMAERKNELEATGEGNVIFAYEESYGYMIGNFVRDKDAVTAAALIAEMTARYSARGVTLPGALDALYEKLGFFYDEAAVSIVMPGADGSRKMRRLMRDLRRSPPDRLKGARVIARRDYLSGREYKYGVAGGGHVTEAPIELSGSDVLRFDTEDGAAVIIRPSGTEPKLKIYILARGKTMRECARMTERYAQWANELSSLRY